jgi:glycosyltransferase involved in cell wall biosynthesis
MTRLDNMHYLNSLPQELYHSALLSADCLLFTTKFIAYLNIVFDAISHKMPIVAYKTSILKDILTPETALLPRTSLPSIRPSKTLRASIRQKRLRKP